MKDIENNNLFPISLLMDRIISKFNPTNCENLYIIYSFIFDNNDPIYLEVKDGFCKILDHAPLHISTTIRTTHKIWQEICLNKASLKNALKENLVKCDGEIKNYILLCKLLEKDLPKDIKNSAAFSISKTSSIEEIPKNKELIQNQNTITKIETPSNIITITEANLPEIKIDESTIKDNKTSILINTLSNDDIKTEGKKVDKKLSKRHKKNKFKTNIFSKDTKLKKNKAPKIKSNHIKYLSIRSLLNVMVANFNPALANDLNITYKFIFENPKPIYLVIKNKTAKLRYQLNNEINTTIISTYKTWYEIIFKNLKIETAILDEKIKCSGETKNLELLTKLFNPILENNEQETKTLKPNPTIWFILAIIPWLFYWTLLHICQPLFTSTFAVLYTTLFITLIKPQNFKKITKLEALTLIIFPFYNLFNVLNPVVFNEIVSSFFLNIILILTLSMSSGCEKSIMSEYSEISYNSEISKTILFKNINKNLTILWSILFTIRFILSLVLETHLNTISYIFTTFGLFISWIYLKLNLSIKG